MARTSFFIIVLTWAAAAIAQQPIPQQSEKAAPQREAKVEPSAAAGGTVRERPDPAEAQRIFRELDRNGDGYLNSDELWSRRGEGANWAASDRNGDGRISPDEFTVLRR